MRRRSMEPLSLSKRGIESQNSRARGPKRMGRLTRMWVRWSSVPNWAAFPGVRLKMRKFKGVIFQKPSPGRKVSTVRRLLRSAK